MATKILDKTAVFQKIRRMAHQVAEENYDAQELILVGVSPNGQVLTEQLSSEIQRILPIKIQSFQVHINKKNPLKSPIQIDLQNISLDHKVVILVDDVANTGKTLYYALKPIMEFSPAKVQVAVLVDRQHKLFPIAADFVGLSLSTTLNEHIRVVMNTEEVSVYLG